MKDPQKHLTARSDPVKHPWSVLSDTTLLPISLVGSLIGIAFWVGSLDKQVQMNAVDAAAMKAAIVDIRATVANIDGKVQYIYDATVNERNKRP